MPLSAPVQLDRAVLSVDGPDATDFLQNLLTQDMSVLERAHAGYAGLLTPQGKVAFDFVIWRDENGYLIDVAEAQAAELAQRLTLYRLRAKVQIEPKPLAVWAGGEGGADPRLPALGPRSLRPANRPPPADEPETYRAHRIALGVPDLARDGAIGEAFALEALFEEFAGVDFHKGCFVGQENVSRMKRRATTRRKFCPIAFEGAAPAYGAAITAGAADLGTVRGGIEGRALAFVRLDRADEAAAQLTADGMIVRLDPPSWLLLPAKAS